MLYSRITNIHKSWGSRGASTDLAWGDSPFMGYGPPPILGTPEFVPLSPNKHDYLCFPCPQSN